MPRAKKRQAAPQVESGNYFPTIDIGLQNNYVYYNSLLSGDDERFALNRVIGQQAQAYLNEIHDLQLSNPADDQDSSTAVTKALGLLYSAYVNERAKEAKWLEEVCTALGIEFSMDNADYIEIIKTLNEVQKGADEALATIKSEAERWSDIDIERVLNSKKLQNKYESAAKRLERVGKVDKAKEYRELGEHLYWGTKGNAGRGDNNLTTIARAIGEIDQRANKLFTGSGRSAASHLEKVLFPYIIRALKVEGYTINFDLSTMQTALRELLDVIMSELISAEIRGKLPSSMKRKANAPSFLKANNSTREQYVKDYINALGTDEIMDRVNRILTTNGYLETLRLPAPTEGQEELQKALKADSDESERVIQRVLKTLAQDKELQAEYIAERKWKSKKTVTAANKDFLEFLRKKFSLNDTITQDSIRQATQAGVRQRYYYSEERTLDEVAQQVFSEHASMVRGKGYRPKGNPKTDTVLGYFHYELGFDNSELKKSQSIAGKIQTELERANQEMDEIYEKAFKGDYDASEEDLNIRRTASLKSYTDNARIFEELRQKQLARLEALANEVAKQQAEVKAIFTKFNVLTTVKDQSGLLDTFTPNNHQLRERGIGFSGGAMGTDDSGIRAIDNIVALGKKGGIMETVDAEWLKFALVNSGLGLIGYKNRSSLENYFSLFASYLMFDDAQNMITDAVAKSAEEIGKKNSVQNIHLYVINGVYMPQSYILYELHKKMTEAMTGASFDTRNLADGTVRTQIYSYNVGSKYPGNTQQDWQNEAQAAAQTTKIKMYFLMNFSNLVSQLSDRMGL